MTEKLNLQLIAAQLEATLNLSKGLLADNHPASIVLQGASNTLAVLISTAEEKPAGEAKDNKDTPSPILRPRGRFIAPDRVEPVVDENNDEVDEDARELTLEEALNEGIDIAGMSADEFVAVLDETPADMAEAILNAENPDDIAVVGTIEVDGETVEVGNWDENMEKIDAGLEELENALAEEGEEPLAEPEKLMLIKYTRLNGETLTEDNVKAIFAHPHSVGLQRLGAELKLANVASTDETNVKIAQIDISDSDRNAMTALALGAMAYAGVKVFPGLGRVEARGSVNFEI